MREFLQYFSVKAYSLPQRFEFYLKKGTKWRQCLATSRNRVRL